MDEIDLKKNIKKAILLFSKVFVGFAIFFSTIALMGNSKNGWGYTKVLLFIALLIGVGLPAILGICYLIINMFFKMINSGRTIIDFDKEYIRDLPKHCSPAIASLIYDLKIDVYKDYTATILYLCIKKYINLIKDGNTYKITIENNKDISDLGRCEKYVLDIIKNKDKFDENQFKKEIIKEAQKKELITDKKHRKTVKVILILIFVVMLLIIAFNINKILFIICISILGAILYAGYLVLEMKNRDQINLEVVNTEYVRTKDGKNIALLLQGLKRYINEYTLIKDKEIDYIHILENYIPYALVLDEADAVEDFIKNNEEYRDLIYNRKIIQQDAC